MSDPEDSRAGPSSTASVGEAVASRARTDELIVGWWALLPAIGIVAGLLVLVSVLLFVPGTGGWALGYVLMYTAGFCFMAVLNFKLLRRLRGHFEREAMLRLALIERARRSRAPTQGLEGLDEGARAHEKLPSALFSAMCVLPLVGFPFEFYYLRHLTRAPPLHDADYVAFMREFASVSQPGGRASVPAEPLVRPRSYAAWALGALLLFPLLALWYRFLIEETNAHFRAQWAVEDGLLQAEGSR